MNSSIAAALKLTLEPVALIWTDDLPDGATQFESGKWGCVMALLASASKGKVVAFARDTFGCVGGGVGLGFGNQYINFPGGEHGFCNFLADGNDKTAQGISIADAMAAAGARPEFCNHFLHGERYRKTPELVRQFLSLLPIMDIPTKYVVFKPLAAVTPDERPVSVTMFVTPDQLSATVILANYDCAVQDSVIIPHAAACQVTGILSYAEEISEQPRCLVGLTDLSARKYLKTSLGSNLMSFTIPFKRFLEMEENVAGSFLESETWLGLQE
jgi:hypothetical protein